jgi:hypothetical protein
MFVKVVDYGAPMIVAHVAEPHQPVDDERRNTTLLHSM